MYACLSISYMLVLTRHTGRPNMCQNPKLEIYYYIQRYATEYISTLRAIKQESIMITHLMHCAAVESEFNAMELNLLHKVRGLHHFMICAYLPARGCGVHMGLMVRFCVKLLCGNTVTMRQHGINLRASQFPHPTPRHNTQSTMLCPMLCYAMLCHAPCYATHHAVHQSMLCPKPLWTHSIP